MITMKGNSSEIFNVNVTLDVKYPISNTMGYPSHCDSFTPYHPLLRQYTLISCLITIVSHLSKFDI